MKAKLYANQIVKRRITILEVPEDLREETMALLPESDYKRQEAVLIEGR